MKWTKRNVANLNKPRNKVKDDNTAPKITPRRFSSTFDPNFSSLIIYRISRWPILNYAPKKPTSDPIYNNGFGELCFTVDLRYFEMRCLGKLMINEQDRFVRDAVLLLFITKLGLSARDG
jgi:hypothetical protein